MSVPNSNALQQAQETIISPSITWRMTEDDILGEVDGLEAMKQSIYLTLSTERYEHVIFSWGYGSEINSLLGKDNLYIKGDIDRIITEALSVDDRILSVDNFEVATDGDEVYVSFNVATIFGNTRIERMNAFGSI